ncbi:DsbA family protein [Ornithinimicrobium cryptoxanthini]|uniref:DsbA family protein n=1 Tax=Ornithinimicrobium cryptoxanthini TaxID=2934161 RepID=UPI0021190FC1|nr:thioredoxin domain-containing protein [Ornithinimicrobium cryptoxanthini]
MPRPPVKVAPPPTKGPSMGLIGGVVALVVAIIAVSVYIVVRPDPVGTGDSASISGGASSASALPNAGGIRVGDAGEDVPVVHIYEDFQCPWCGLLEQTSGAAFTKAAQAGEIQLTYTLMSFLDGNIGNDSSIRAANAAMCADDQGAFVPYHAALYAEQPEEGAGWTDEQLIETADQVGVDDIEEFTGCLDDETHFDYVRDMQTRSNQEGVTGSPRVFIDGEELGSEDMNNLLYDPTALTGILANRQ